jgi:hypothetical protein
MELTQCKVKSVNANIGNGEITISFSMTLTDDNLDTAKAISAYSDMDRFEVQVIPQQLPLPGLGAMTEAVLNRENED